MKTKELEQVKGRSDLFKVDPTTIKIEDGWNPREDWGDLETLANDIGENGVLVPIRVKRVGDDLVLVNGERRLKAVAMLAERGVKIETIPAMLTESKAQAELMFEAMSSNAGKPFTFSEEAEAFRRLESWGISQADIARRVGRDPVYVMGRLRFAKEASAVVRKAFEESKISHTVAIQLLGTVKKPNDDTAQKAALAEVLANVKQAKADGKKPKAARVDRKNLPKPGRIEVKPSEIQKSILDALAEAGYSAIFSAKHAHGKILKFENENDKKAFDVMIYQNHDGTADVYALGEAFGLAQTDQVASKMKKFLAHE